MNNRTHLLALILSVALFSCNPDCDSVFGLRITTAATEAGNEVLITAQPPSSLQGRRVFIENKEVETRFADNMGLVVAVPEGLSGAVDVRVEDPDCADFVSLNLDVQDASFFQNNPQFVFPTIPEIIIPTVQAPFPPSIENAWLNVENIDYCIWIVLLTDSLTGDCIRVLDSELSFEQSTCYKDNPNKSLLYKQNHISGYLDLDGNIFMTIHRPGGDENLTGRLVSLDDVPDKYKEWSFNAPADCDPGLPPGAAPVPERNHMMLLTSKSNGNQLLIYQQVIDGIGETCKF
jgi:hypothetical protein